VVEASLTIPMLCCAQQLKGAPEKCIVEIFEGNAEKVKAPDSVTKRPTFVYMQLCELIVTPDVVVVNEKFPSSYESKV
jgi:hypothetical protein